MKALLLARVSSKEQEEGQFAAYILQYKQEKIVQR
jgi:hypothetical protein